MVVSVSGTVRNDGETRNEYREGLGVLGRPYGAGVTLVPTLRNRVTSASVTGRRNALRPNALMVFVQVVAAVPPADGSQLMNLAFMVALARTAFAIAEPVSL